MYRPSVSIEALVGPPASETSTFLLGVGTPLLPILLIALSASARARLNRDIATLKATGRYPQWRRRNLIFIVFERLTLVLILFAAILWLLVWPRDYEFSLWFFAAFLHAMPVHLIASFFLASRRPKSVQPATASQESGTQSPRIP